MKQKINPAMTTDFDPVRKGQLKRALDALTELKVRLQLLAFLSTDYKRLSGAQAALQFPHPPLIALHIALALRADVDALQRLILRARDALDAWIANAGYTELEDIRCALNPYGSMPPKQERKVAAMGMDGLIYLTDSPRTWLWLAPEWAHDEHYAAAVERYTEPAGESSSWPRRLKYSLRLTSNYIVDHITGQGAITWIEPDWDFISRATDHPSAKR